MLPFFAFSNIVLYLGGRWGRGKEKVQRIPRDTCQQALAIPFLEIN